MEATITARQAKAEFLGLIDRVANGTIGPVTVIKNGKARVLIVPMARANLEGVPSRTGYGALKGMAVPLGEFAYNQAALDDEPSADCENLPECVFSCSIHVR